MNLIFYLKNEEINKLPLPSVISAYGVCFENDYSINNLVTSAREK